MAYLIGMVKTESLPRELLKEAFRLSFYGNDELDEYIIIMSELINNGKGNTVFYLLDNLRRGQFENLKDLNARYLEKIKTK